MTFSSMIARIRTVPKMTEVMACERRRDSALSFARACTEPFAACQHRLS